MLSALIIVGKLANGFTNQGNINESPNSLDFAISGEGWIPLEQKDGKLVYTRYGEFGMNSEAASQRDQRSNVEPHRDVVE